MLFFKRVILKTHRSTVAAAVVLPIGHQIIRRLTSRPIVCMSTGCFPDMTSSLAKCKQTSGAHLKDDFLTNCLFCDIPQYFNVFYYIKHKRRAVYFNNQKNVAFDL